MSLFNKLKQGICITGLAGLLGIASGCKAGSGPDKPPVNNDAPYFYAPVILVNDSPYSGGTPVTVNEGDNVKITVEAVDNEYDTIYLEMDMDSQLSLSGTSTWYPGNETGMLEWDISSTAGDTPSVNQPYQPLFRAWDDSHISAPTELAIDIYVNDTQ
jgi:hypothetical protein